MDGKLKAHQFVHVKPMVEDEEVEDDKCLNENNSENDGDETVPLGLTGKAVCVQVHFFFFNFFPIQSYEFKSPSCEKELFETSLIEST